MPKIIKITEEKFNMLKKVIAEDLERNIEDDNYNPFASQMDNHDEGIVGEPSDPTVYNPNGDDEYEEDVDWYRDDVIGWNDSPSDGDLYSGRW